MIKRFKKIFTIIVLSFLMCTSLNPHGTQAVENVLLFTPYTGLSASPGETIEYTVTVINSGSTIKTMSFSLDGLPKGWNYQLSANGREIQQLSVKANSEETINLAVTVPGEVKQDDYRFTLVAKEGSGSSSLQFLVHITEEGTTVSDLSTEQANLQGHADSQFTYTATIRNRTASQKNYALSSQAGEGWGVVFKSGADSISSIAVEPNESKDITIEVTPPENIKEGTYEIPIRAQAGEITADLTLEAVITGSYAMELTTPDGNLSTDITAGKDKVIDLVVKNTGTASLVDINLSAQTPPNWETEFDKNTIAQLEPGKSETIKVTVTASDEAIAGDYVVTFSASSAETSSEATFRISVETSTLWGIVAVLIIALVVAGLYYIVRKYGRR